MLWPPRGVTTADDFQSPLWRALRQGKRICICAEKALRGFELDYRLTGNTRDHRNLALQAIASEMEPCMENSP